MSESSTSPRAQLGPSRLAAVGILAVIHSAYAFLAFWDLTHRPPGQVRGPKPAWVPVLLVKWIGPTAYFYAHRNR